MTFTNAERWMSYQIGVHIAAIETSSVQPIAGPVTSSSAPILLCTYNWKNTKKPAIHVPGTAPRWITKSLPITLPRDRGEFFVDQNRSKNPEYPLEVMFQALAIMKPDYRFDGVDILVNRNSLRKLFNFCYGRPQPSFRINLYTVSDTLILERYEKVAVERLDGSVRSGYGHNFERTFTKFPPGLEDSTSHHRILEYMLGDLRLAVRFEVDALFSPDVADDEALLTKDAVEPVAPTHGDIEQLSERLVSLRVSKIAVQDVSTDQTPITISQMGSISPQAATAEIKTGKRPMAHVLPQMWFGRTPYLIQGHHVQGVFDKINIRCMDKELIEWENDPQNQQALCKMAGLIKLVRAEMKESENRAAAMIFQRSQPGKLQIYGQKSAKKALPNWAIAEFWARAEDTPTVKRDA